jgi:hypothetical protein
MSSNSQVLNTGQQTITNYETSKTFVFGNRYDKADYTNGTGAPVTVVLGTLLGRISATQKVIPLASAASDGSQFPVGIATEDTVIAAGATVKLSYCVEGDVAEEKVVLNGSDTLSTVISGRSIRDRIASDTVGIRLVKSTELTAYDNQ